MTRLSADDTSLTYSSANSDDIKHILNDDLSRLSPEVIKLFSFSTQLSMKFFLLINVKMPTIVGILIFMSRKNSLLHLSEPDKS